MYGPDIRARLEHQSSLDVFQARGGTLPRRRPTPRVTEVHAGSVINGNGWTVTVGSAAHVQPQLECLAYRIDADDGSICYSGDSGACDALADLARGCDILIHMNHHFSGTEPSPRTVRPAAITSTTRRLAQDAGVKTLVLTHLLPQIDRPGIREQIVHEIQQVFAGRVIWGEDLMELTVARPGAASDEDRKAANLSCRSSRWWTAGRRVRRCASS